MSDHHLPGPSAGPASPLLAHQPIDVLTTSVVSGRSSGRSGADPESEGVLGRQSVVPRTLTLFVLTISALGLLSFPIGGYDDSLLMVGARLVASGKLPYKDFYTHYGPLGYTILAALLRLFGHPGLALRIGQIALLTAVAGLLFWLFRSVQPSRRLREYVVAPVVLAFSQVAMEPTFFGFAFGTAGLIFFALARIESRIRPACLLFAAAGVAFAVAALTRPGFVIYLAGALLILEALAGRPQFGALRSPLLALGLVFGTAASTALVLWLLLYSKISPTLALTSAIIVPARLISNGERYRRPIFLQDVWNFQEAIATGSALVAVTVAWVFAIARLKLRRTAAVCIAAGGILLLWLMLSIHPARNVGFLAMALVALAGLAVFAGRDELKRSALLRTSATFGIAAAAFGHYFWARADVHHLLPFLTLALIGGAL